MKPTESEIESTLRNAPRPRPPASLKPKLLEDIPLSSASPGPHSHTIVYRRPWWTRWWPSLATGGVAALCLVVLGVQQNQIRELKHSLDEQQTLAASVLPGTGEQLTASTKNRGATTVIPNGRAEIEELRRLVQQLQEEVRALEAMQAENKQLQNQPELQATFDAEELQQMQTMRAKAQSIKCVNNMKQLGLAVRIWASDNGDTFPSGVLSLQNEIGGNLSILVCPNDPMRQPAANWQSLNAANMSYEYLGANGPFDEPSRVLFRCPVHGNITLFDGSVQQAVAQNHPEWLVQRNGKLYLEGPNSAGKSAPAPAQGTRYKGMSLEMMKRYGLSPETIPNQKSTPYE